MFIIIQEANKKLFHNNAITNEIIQKRKKI